MAHHVIYIPGLGDITSYGQSLAIQLWRLYGLRPHYLPLGWAGKEKFEPKLGRLLDKVDSLEKSGNKVSLVGVSAGASAVLNAYAKRKNIAGVVCIVGKIHNPQTVGDRIYKINPSFKESMLQVVGSLDGLGEAKKSRIMCIYNRADKTVPNKDSVIEGALNRKFLGWGHISAIFFTVTLGGPLIARFLHRQARSK